MTGPNERRGTPDGPASEPAGSTTPGRPINCTFTLR